MMEPSSVSVSHPMGMNPISTSQSTISKVTLVAIVALTGLVALGAIHATAYFVLPVVPLSFSLAVTALVISATALAILIALLVKRKSSHEQSASASQPPSSPSPLPPGVVASAAPQPYRSAVSNLGIVRPIRPESEVKVRIENVRKQGEFEKPSKPFASAANLAQAMVKEKALFSESECRNKAISFQAYITRAIFSENVTYILDEIVEAENFINIMPEQYRDLQPVRVLQMFIMHGKLAVEAIKKTVVLSDAIRSGDVVKIMNGVNEAENFINSILGKHMRIQFDEIEILKSYITYGRSTIEWIKTGEKLNEDLRTALGSGQLILIRDVAAMLREHMHYKLPSLLDDQSVEDRLECFSTAMVEAVGEQEDWICKVLTQVEIAQDAEHILQQADRVTKSIPSAKTLAEAEALKKQIKLELTKAKDVLKKIDENFRGYIQKLFEEIPRIDKKADELCQKLQTRLKHASEAANSKSPVKSPVTVEKSKVQELMFNLSSQKHMYGGGVPGMVNVGGLTKTVKPLSPGAAPVQSL